MPKAALTTCQRFLKENNICWQKTPHNGKVYYILAVQTGEEDCTVIQPQIAVSNGPVALSSKLTMATEDPTDENVLLGFACYLLFGNYHTLFTAEGTPILLEGMPEAQKALANFPYQNLEGFNILQAGVQEGLDNLTKTTEIARIQFENEQEDDE